MAPLAYPKQYPPVGWWKKFFVGVRWLGPDLRFFKALKQEQASRGELCMSAWGGGRREEIAAAVSAAIATQVGWRSPYFLPEDSAAVVLRGPSFDFSEPEDAIAATTELLLSQFNIAVPTPFWAAHWHLGFGELIDAISALDRRATVGVA